MKAIKKKKKLPNVPSTWFNDTENLKSHFILSHVLEFNKKNYYNISDNSHFNFENIDGMLQDKIVFVK